MKNRLRNISAILLALISLVCSARSYSAITNEESKILSHIDAESMMGNIDRLCSDSFRGRQAGSVESKQAADYLVSEFERYGLSPIPSSAMAGYEEPLTMRYSLVRSPDDIKARISYKDKTKIFTYRGFNGNGGLNIRSNVVFVGYGIHDPKAGYDNYAKIDVRGKIVLWLPGSPDGVKLNKTSSGAQKMLSAYQQGASACLIYKPYGKDDPWGTNVGLSGPIANFPCIAMDEKMAADVMTTGKKSIRTLPIGSLGAKLSIAINPIYDPERKTYNVLGEIPGSDPNLSHQVVMIGAHYDHLGYLPTGEIFRGADDNASGTSVVLAVARAIHQAGVRPRRTIVFASWTAEEAGLIGSNYFAENPPFPLSSIVSNIELDMVGCGNKNSFMTTGAAAYPTHYKYLKDSARDLHMSLTADSIPGASDHLSFSRRNIPASLLYSAGLHPHYHTTKDVPKSLNKDVLTSAARLSALAIWRAANS